MPESRWNTFGGVTPSTTWCESINLRVGKGENRHLFHRYIKKLDLFSPACIIGEIQHGAEMGTPNPAPVRLDSLDVG